VKKFGTVVVGAGSSGCALVGRLAALTDEPICLVEAGPDYGPLADGRWPPELLDARQFPDTHDWGWLETRNGELRHESRAKVVGGCSAHNQCAALWPEPAELDAWGVEGWDALSLAESRRRVDEAVAPRPHPEDSLASWQRAFRDAAVAAGYGDSVGPFVANVRDGVRWNSAFAFLDPVRDRVTVLSNGVADRLVLDGDRAIELACSTGTISARRFVLCAGTFASPGILARSGLRPPGLGANLHDHCGMAVTFVPTPRAVDALAADLERGIFHQSQIVLRTDDLHVAPFHGRVDDCWSFGILVFNLAPRSRGRLEPNTDPLASPMIDFGFLSDPADARVLEDALGVVRAIARRPPLAALVSGEIGTAVTGYAHAVGTCRLGEVVDPSCRVRGTSNVFVADASIIPTIPRANPNLLCFLIGDRAAELIAAA
jgi:choline dehydrogenase